MTSESLGSHNFDYRIDQRSWREVLACAGLFLTCVALEQILIQVAEALALGAIPVELIDLFNKRRERYGLPDERGRIREDLLHQRRSVGAQVQERLLVELEAIGGGPRLEIIPAEPFGQLVLGPGLLCHLEKEEVSQLGDVLVVRHPVVAQVIAEVPEFCTNIVGQV